MAWSDTWDAAFIYWGARDLENDVDLPSVKHLLADLCNAIQERQRYRFDEQEAWMIGDRSTVMDPEPDDFRGTLLNTSDLTPEKLTMPEICSELLSRLEGLFAAGGGIDAQFYTDDTFTTHLTYAAAVTAAAGLSQEQLEEVDGDGKLKNWRQRGWWETLRAVVEQARYVEVRCGGRSGEADQDVYGWDTSYPDFERGVDVSRQDAWENFWETEGAGPFVGIGISGKYIWFPAVMAVPYEWWYENAIYSRWNDLPIAWDSDEKFETGTGYVARDFPIPKTAHNGKLRGVLYAYCEEIKWAKDFAGTQRDSGEPDISDFSLDLEFLGGEYSMEGTLDNTASFSVVGTGDADGTDTLTVTMPTTAPAMVCEGGYLPDGHDDPELIFEIGLLFSGQLAAGVRHINAQFDLNSVVDYPAA